MMPRLLTVYIAKRFSAMLALIVASVGLLILLADYIDVLRRFSGDSGFTAVIGLKLAAMRVPILLDETLPFAFLFAAVLSLLSLSRKLELVVARASGVSAWGFLRGPSMIAIVFGALATAVLNPIAANFKNQAENLEAEISQRQPKEGGHWFRQAGGSGSSVFYAGSAGKDGRTLFGVTAFVFDAAGKFYEKVSAARAELEDGRWILNDAAVISAGDPPRRLDQYELPTELSAGELRRSFIEPEATSVWALPDFIDTAGRTGINPDRFRITFHALLSRPLYLLAMVTIAATVSLRLTRFGGTWRFIVTGAAIGFLLYVLTDIASDIGGHGIVSPVLAAWLPPIVALTFGATALLHQEDG